ncbi:30S ribosomal protein S21 [Candidatus Calescamantes bacterium]|nr:30S ribosomal protein S21 [Candidatus Calescamantes bacterium]HDO70646.1 30S ribosomal protein S21 [bacterium]HEX67654.1 30S ribosomal protein S21 [bacterium]
MPTVIVEKGEPLDRALKKFKKKLEREGLMKEMKRTEFYEKKSVKRRKKEQKARKKIAQMARLQKLL